MYLELFIDATEKKNMKNYNSIKARITISLGESTTVRVCIYGRIGGVLFLEETN